MDRTYWLLLEPIGYCWKRMAINRANDKWQMTNKPIKSLREKRNVYDVAFYFQDFWLKDGLCIQALMQTQIREKKAFLWYNFSMTSKYKIGMDPQYEYQIKRNQHFCQVFTNTHINRWNKIYGFQPFRNCVLNHLFFKCGGSWVKEYWLKSCMGDWIGKSYTGD